MSEGGAALMAVGSASGEDRARIAAEQAISSQLLDVTINGAHGILFNVTGGNSLSLHEVNQAAAIIKETAHPDVNLIFGAVVDESMGDVVRITVIATGFDQSNPRGIHEVERPKGKSNQGTKQADYSGMTEESSNTIEFPAYINTDDIDVPAFIRKRRDNLVSN